MGISLGSSIGAVNADEAWVGATRGARAARAAAVGAGTAKDGEAKKAFATRSFSGGSGSVPSSGRITMAAAPTACSATVSGHAQAPAGGASPTRVAKRGRGAVIEVSMLGSRGPGAARDGRGR